MNVRQCIVSVTMPPTVSDIIASAPLAFKGIHISFMVAKVLIYISGLLHVHSSCCSLRFYYVLDINECEVLKPCNKICHNFLGEFKCSYPKGYEGDGMKKGTCCSYLVSQFKTFIIVLSKYILTNC